jgi:hypothetical protein
MANLPPEEKLKRMAKRVGIYRKQIRELQKALKLWKEVAGHAVSDNMYLRERHNKCQLKE